MSTDFFSRREFLRKGGTASMGLALGLPDWNIEHRTSPIEHRQFTAAPSDTIGLGIIGTGSRGTYLAKLSQNVPQLKVLACCDIIPEQLSEGLKRADKKAKGYADYRKLLENKDVEAVIVATPQSFHTDIALAALDAGKHVYCEKTLTYNPEETRKLVSRVKNAKTIFQAGFQERVNPLHHKIKEIIAKGTAGEITHVAAQYSYHTSQRKKVDNPRWERMLNWRLYREFTGGPLDELSAHQIDIVSFILGKSPVKAVGLGGTNFYPKERETFDNTQVLYEYEGGVKGNFTCLMTTEYMGYNIMFYGTKATIEIWNVDGNRGNLYFEFDPSRQPQPPPENVDGISGATRRIWGRADPVPILVEGQPRWDTETSTLSLKHFAECVLARKTPLSNVETGGTSANAVHMGNAAMQHGTVEVWGDKYIIG